MKRSMRSALWPRLGPGWQVLVERLREELIELDPGAELSFELDAYGLPRLRGYVSPELRPYATELLRRYDSELLECCQLCGGGGRVYGGPVLTVRCPDCV